MQSSEKWKDGGNELKSCVLSTFSFFVFVADLSVAQQKNITLNVQWVNSCFLQAYKSLSLAAKIQQQVNEL